MTTRNEEKTPKSGADVVVQTLEQRGVEYVFGVPGAKIDKPRSVNGKSWIGVKEVDLVRDAAKSLDAEASPSG